MALDGAVDGAGTQHASMKRELDPPQVLHAYNPHADRYDELLPHLLQAGARKGKEKIHRFILPGYRDLGNIRMMTITMCPFFGGHVNVFQIHFPRVRRRSQKVGDKFGRLTCSSSSFCKLF